MDDPYGNCPNFPNAVNEDGLNTYPAWAFDDPISYGKFGKSELVCEAEPKSAESHYYISIVRNEDIDPTCPLSAPESSNQWAVTVGDKSLPYSSTCPGPPPPPPIPPPPPPPFPPPFPPAILPDDARGWYWSWEAGRDCDSVCSLIAPSPLTSNNLLCNDDMFNQVCRCLTGRGDESWVKGRS